MDDRTFWLQFFLPAMGGLLIGGAVGLAGIWIVHVAIWHITSHAWPWNDRYDRGA